MSEVIIVTGANRGIGLAICQAIAGQPKSRVLYCTSRSGANLDAEMPKDTKSKLHYRKLDVEDQKSIKELADSVEQEYGGVDVVINNCGVNIDKQGFKPDPILKTFNINYLGTKRMCDACLPLMKKDGRIVNLSSVAGHLQSYSKEITAQFREAASSTSKLEQMAIEFQEAAKNGKAAEAGYRNSAYCISKCFVVALTRALAAEKPGLFINACCPGWVSTDMGKIMGNPAKTLEDGAKIPVRLATGDIQNASGEFWENSDIASAESGHISKW